MQGSAVLLYKRLETRRAIIPSLSRVAQKNRAAQTPQQVQYGTLAARPMIVGTGIDIAEVARIRAAVNRFGDRFLKRVFTFEEVRYCTSKANAAERLAARFAAKEAGMKAIGTGLRGGVTWHDVEVVRVSGQRPLLRFHGKAAEVADSLGCKRTHLSLSHTEEQAIASVILES